MKYLHNVIKSPKIVVEEHGARISTRIDLQNDDTNTVPMLPITEVEVKMDNLRKQHQADLEHTYEEFRQQMDLQKQNFENEKADFVRQNYSIAQRELENAKLEGQRYLIETEKLCEDNLNKATAEGLEKGYAEGYEKAMAENQLLVSQLKNVIDGISIAQREIIEKYEEQIIDYAVDLASKIIGSQIKSDDKAVIALVSDTMSKLKDFKRVKIHLAGFDVKAEALVSELVAKKLVEYKEYVSVDFLDDAPDGTCIVETDDEIIDTSVYDQIKNLSKRLREGRREI